jgi:hypothetical protein
MGLLRRSVPKAAVAGERKPFTAARAKRYLGIGRTVAPLLAPYALVAAGAVRARWDSYRAERMGVTLQQLPEFRGRGGPLYARLSRVAESLDRLDTTDEAPATSAARKFALDTRPRIADLAIAVRAAEQMPAQRRRAAFKAIGGELDGIESTLLTHLGVAT